MTVFRYDLNLRCALRDQPRLTVAQWGPDRDEHLRVSAVLAMPARREQFASPRSDLAPGDFTPTCSPTTSPTGSAL